MSFIHVAQLSLGNTIPYVVKPSLVSTQPSNTGATHDTCAQLVIIQNQPFFLNLLPPTHVAQLSQVPVQHASMPLVDFNLSPQLGVPKHGDVQLLHLVHCSPLEFYCLI